MKHFYATIQISENGQIIWSKSEKAKWRKFAKLNKGKAITLTASELSPIRNEEHMRLLWLKIGTVSKITGYYKMEILALLAESLGLGQEVESDSIHRFFNKFRRISTKILTTAQVNDIHERLEEFRIFYNEGREAEHWLEWPELNLTRQKAAVK